MDPPIVPTFAIDSPTTQDLLPDIRERRRLTPGSTGTGPVPSVPSASCGWPPHVEGENVQDSHLQQKPTELGASFSWLADVNSLALLYAAQNTV